jgi:hypothetical protein
VPLPISVSDIVALHESLPARWEALAPATAADSRETDEGASIRSLVEAAHFANFTIWGLEDEARRRDVGDARIAAVKRAIDPWNQRRNDLMERIDAAILAHFANVDLESSELHSESAGMIIDRMSILALKIRNMERVAADASAQHEDALAAECSARRAVLAAQREDLAGCLGRLFDDFAAGRRHFRNYFQMKSYNDERLNPSLRAARKNRGQAPN